MVEETIERIARLPVNPGGMIFLFLSAKEIGKKEGCVQSFGDEIRLDVEELKRKKAPRGRGNFASM